jgi:hypothetical protein
LRSSIVIALVSQAKFGQLPLHSVDTVNGCFPGHRACLNLPGVPLLFCDLSAFKRFKVHVILLAQLPIGQMIMAQTPPTLGSQQQAQLFITIEYQFDRVRSYV